MRYVPGQLTDIKRENEELKQKVEKIQADKEKKRQAALKRNDLRERLLFDFIRENNLDPKHEIIKYIRKAFSSPRSSNISGAVYKGELDLITWGIKERGLDCMTAKVVYNIEKGYLHLIYENQVIYNSKYNSKKGNKDNIVANKTNTYGECRKLSDFYGYRTYLDDPMDDEELAKFVLDNFGIVTRKDG